MSVANHGSRGFFSFQILREVQVYGENIVPLPSWTGIIILLLVLLQDWFVVLSRAEGAMW